MTKKASDAFTLIVYALPDDLFEELKEEIEIVSDFLRKTSTNYCPYCGRPNTRSMDPEALCDECAEDFGHAFIWEL